MLKKKENGLEYMFVFGGCRYMDDEVGEGGIFTEKSGGKSFFSTFRKRKNKR